METRKIGSKMDKRLECESEAQLHMASFWKTEFGGGREEQFIAMYSIVT